MFRSLPERLASLVDGPHARTRCVLASILLICLLWPSDTPAAQVLGTYSHRQILDAIRWVETRNLVDPGEGDAGKAIGPYQIHEVYWKDAELPGGYQECRQKAYAESVIEAYMRRYVPKAWRDRDPEVIARTHNGGPRGRYKTATDRYWDLVRRTLIGDPPR